MASPLRPNQRDDAIPAVPTGDAADRLMRRATPQPESLAQNIGRNLRADLRALGRVDANDVAGGLVALGPAGGLAAGGVRGATAAATGLRAARAAGMTAPRIARAATTPANIVGTGTRAALAGTTLATAGAAGANQARRSGAVGGAPQAAGTGTFQMQGGPLREVRADGTITGRPSTNGRLNTISAGQVPAAIAQGSGSPLRPQVPRGTGGTGAAIRNSDEARRRLEIALKTVGKGSPSTRRALLEMYGAEQEAGRQFSADRTIQRDELANTRAIADQADATNREKNAIDLLGKRQSALRAQNEAVGERFESLLAQARARFTGPDGKVDEARARAAADNIVRNAPGVLAADPIAAQRAQADMWDQWELMRAAGKDPTRDDFVQIAPGSPSRKPTWAQGFDPASDVTLRDNVRDVFDGLPLVDSAAYVQAEDGSIVRERDLSEAGRRAVLRAQRGR